MSAALRTEGLAKTYVRRERGGDVLVPALAGVDLELQAGRFVSIVGPSGCGKSTLLGILAGLVEPSGGRVLLDGHAPGSLLGRLAYMPQRDLLMPWRRLLDNVTVGLEMDGMPRARARKLARAQLARFGLEGFERSWPAGLSGGMRQRAALLRTFLTGRDALLLDEPLGALDALTRQAMGAWLLEVWEANRKTILLVTHDVDESVLLSDRVYVMSPRPGRIVAAVDVELARPRAPEVVTSTEFLAIKRRVLEPLRDAATAQAGVAA